MDGSAGFRSNRRKIKGVDVTGVSQKVSPLKVNTFRMNSIDSGKPATQEQGHPMNTRRTTNPGESSYGK